MATSGTYVFNLEIAEAIEEAIENCQLDPDTFSVDNYESIRRSLNLLFLDWANYTIHLWKVGPVETVTTTQGLNTFTLGVGTVDLIDAYVTVPAGATGTAANDIMMEAIGRVEYAMIPNKNIQTRPNQYWIEKLTSGFIVHLYPTPDASYTLSYYRLLQLQDVSTFAENPDLPQIWLAALTTGLAAKLAIKFVKDPQLRSELRQEAQAALQRAMLENRERVPLILQPDMGYLSIP